MRIRVLFFAVIYFLSCTENDETEPFFCVDCDQHDYYQIIVENPVILNLEQGIYCIGDSIFLMPDGHYYTIVDEDLISTMFNSMHCSSLEINELTQ